MKPFALYEPETLDEALQAASEDDTVVMAGGTALLLLMRQRVFSPARAVWLGGLPGLDGVSEDAAGALHIGPLLRHAEVARNATVHRFAPLLAEAEAEVGDPQIRNMATLGGNLCHGDPQSDPPSALLALNASVELRRVGGQRVLPLDSFFTGYYETAREPDELLVDILVPAQPAGMESLYTRLVAPFDDRPLVSVALAVQREDGAFRDVRIAVGAAAAVPFRARAAEERLRGGEVNTALLSEAADLVARDLDALEDYRATADYRRRITKVLVQRSFRRLLGLGNGA